MMFNHNILRFSFVTALLLVSGFTLANNKYEALYASYLLSSDTASVKLGAKSIQVKSGISQYTHDLVAEVFLSDLAGNNELDIDTQAWLAKALGSSTSNRYLEILQAAKSTTESRKLIRYIDQSITLLTTAAAESYKPGSLSLEHTRSHLVAMQKQDASARAKNSQDHIRDGELLPALLNRLGLPDSANTIAGQVAIRGAGGWAPGRVAVQQMLLTYNGIGEVQLARSRENGGEWASYFVLNYQGNDENSLPAYRQMFSITDPQLFATAISTLRRRQPRVPALLDLLAERLYQSHLIKKGHVASGLAHTAAILGESLNPRYRYVLQVAKNDAASRGVRKWSKWAYKRIPENDVSQYQPGDAQL